MFRVRHLLKGIFLLLILSLFALSAAAQEANPDAVEGAALYEAGDYEAAYEPLMRAAHADPMDGEIQARYLVTLLRTGRYGSLAFPFNNLFGFAPEMLETIDAEAEAALAANPDDEGAAVVAAALAVELGHEDVQAAIDRVFDFEPESAFGYDLIGYMHRYAGDMDRSIEAIERAVELGADDPQILVDTASVFAFNANDPERAIELLSRAIELDPTFADAYTNRGIVYSFLLSDLDAALADFERAIALKPFDHQIYGQRGSAYQAAGEDESAYADFVRVLEIFPESPNGMWGVLSTSLTTGMSAQPFIDTRDLVEADTVLTLDSPFTGEMTANRLIRLPAEAEPGNYTVTMRATDPMTLDPLLFIVNSDNAVVALNDDIDGSGDRAEGAFNAQITGMAEADETYTVYLLHSGAGSEGEFTVTLEPAASS